MKSYLCGGLLSNTVRMTIIDFLERNVKEVPHKGIYFETSKEDKFISYARLKEEALYLLDYLHQQGVEKGSYVIFQIDEPYMFIKTFWACILGGIIAVPLTGNSSLRKNEITKKLKNVYKSLGEPYILIEKSTSLNYLDHFDKTTKCISLEDIEVGLLQKAQVEKVGMEDVAYIQYSSGSTNEPKGIVLTHGELCANMQQIYEQTQIEEGECVGNWLPLTHDMGLVGFHLYPTSRGCNQFITTPMSFIRRPLRFLSNISKYGMSVIALPNFAQRWLIKRVTTEELDAVDLSSIKFIFNGSEPIHVDTLKSFNAYFKEAGLNEKAMYPVYGMAEACIGVTFPDKSDKLTFCEKDGQQYVSVGRPLKGIEIIIANDEDEVVEEGVVGNILIKGPNITKGYYNRCQQDYFYNDYLKTGDLGFVVDQKLYISGRKKDLFFVNGQNFYLHDLEATLYEYGIEDTAAVFSDVRQALIIFKKHKGKLEQSEGEKISSILEKHYGLKPSYILPVPSIEKTTSGKIKRFELLRQYEEWEKKQKLHAIWQQVLEVTACTEENFFALGGDSLKLLYLAEELEKAFNITIDLDEFMEMPTLSYLQGYISRTAVNNIGVNESKLEEKLPEGAKEWSLTPLQSAYFIGRQEGYQCNGTSKIVYEIETKLDLKQLNESLNKVIKMQPALRIIILPDGKQSVLEEVPSYEMKIEDLSYLSKAQQDLQLDQIFKELQQDTIKLNEWPLFKAYGYKVSDGVSHIFIMIDLIIADGLSIQVFVNQLLKAYFNPETVIKEDKGFIQYLSQKQKKSSKYEDSKLYWLAQRETFPSAPALPYRSNSNEVLSYNRKTRSIAKEKWQAIKEVLKKHCITPTTFLLAIYAKALAFYSGQKHFAINMPVFDRSAVQQSAIGDFTVVLLIEICGVENDFITFCKELQLKVNKALQHKEYDGVEFIREISKQNEGRLYPVVFTGMLSEVFNYDTAEIGTVVRGYSQTTQVFLDCQVYEIQGQLIVNFDYAATLFDEEFIQQMFEAYVSHIIPDAIDKNSCRYTLSKRDQHIVQQYNATKQPIAAGHLIKLMKNNFIQYKDQCAVKDEAGQMTYEQLDKASNKVAHYLKEKGISAQDVVAVKGTRDIQTMIYILGILKVSAVFVPIEKTYPNDRISYILEKAQCKLLLEQDTWENEHIADYREMEVIANYDMEDVAYIIFTSGSTGMPKGVYVTHKAVTNTILAINSQFKLGYKERWFSVSSISFDLFIYDLFGALLGGGVLVLAPDIYEINRVIEMAQKEAVTVWNSVPAVMKLFVETLEYMDNASSKHYYEGFTNKKSLQCTRIFALRLILLSGDWIPLDLPEKIRQKIGTTQTISLGGATEASIWSIYYPIHKVEAGWKSIPYGYPLPNQQMYILDEIGNIAPIGVSGEICIGGKGVAEGYYNDAERTAKAFSIHPQLGKIYYTGDYGVLEKTGYITFLGRRDQQVKINGFRIEIGEVEVKLKSLTCVKEALVCLEEIQGNKQIAAYIVSNRSVSKEEIRTELTKYLPHYMLPHKIVFIEKLPLTSNGKIDRKALAKLVTHQNEAADQNENWTATESIIRGIWEQQLNQSITAKNMSFIELGGDSLGMLQAVNKLKKALNKEITLGEFMTLGSIKNLGQYFDKLTEECEELTYPTLEGDRENRLAAFPLTDIQMAYFIGRNKAIQMGGIATYAFYEIKTSLDIHRLNQSLNKVIAKQSMLKMYVNEEGAQQFLQEEPCYEMICHDMKDASKAAQQSTLQEMRKEYEQLTFNPHQWPLFKFEAVEVEKQQYHLFVAMDLLIADGMSMRLMINELLKYYKDESLEIPEETFTFRDYMIGLHQMQKQKAYQKAKAYWENKILTLPSAPKLPMKNNPEHIQKPHYDRFMEVIAQETWHKIKYNLKHYNITPSAYLLTAFGLALAKLTEAKALTINLTVFTRYPFHSKVNEMIGDFTSTMLVDLDFSLDEFIKCCEVTQNNMAASLENRLYDGVKVSREIGRRNRCANKLMFPIVFTSMLFDQKEFKSLHDLGEVIYSKSQTAQVYLDCQVMEDEQGLILTWDYVTELFDETLLRQQFELFINYINNQILNQGQSLELAKSNNIETALIEHVAEYEGHQCILPRNEMERVLYEAMREILNCNDLSVTDNFFDLGADSIKAINLYNRLKQSYEIEINEIFEARNIAELALMIKPKENNMNEKLQVLKQQYGSEILIDSMNENIEGIYQQYIQGIDKYQFKASKKKKLENILLIGATGYLGAYILKTLLEVEQSNIYVLLRGNNGIERLREQLIFYFEKDLYEMYKERIFVVKGDFTQDHLGLKPEVYNALIHKIDGVFNCGGKVDHFGKYETFYLANVKSTMNVLEFCQKDHTKAYYHMSTTRILEGDGEHYQLFTEEDKITRKEFEDYYNQTKQESEVLVYAAQDAGLEAYIFRIGNIVFNTDNGKCQKNIYSNGFYLIMQAFINLGIMPSLDIDLIDFSFVDELSKAIVLLAYCEDLHPQNYHLYNPYKISMTEFYKLLKAGGLRQELRILEFEAFYDKVYELYKEDTYQRDIDTLLIHGSSYMALDGLTGIKVNDKTNAILKELGFNWSKVTLNHIKKMLEYIDEIGFLEQKKMEVC